MNSQEFRQAARTTFALAMDAYYAVSNNNDATMEELIAADAAKTAADAQWIADQHTANTMAQAELDAATAKGCEEVVEVVSAEAFLNNARITFEAAMMAHAEAFSKVNQHQSYEFFKNAQDAYNAASAQWLADQRTANIMANR